MRGHEQTPAFPDWHGTTILAVRKGGSTVIAGDGQVSMGQTIVKGNARRCARLAGGQVVAGFAGATADAFTLIERLEAKLEQYPDQLARACVDLAKDWRTDRYLRRLEAHADRRRRQRDLHRLRRRRRAGAGAAASRPSARAAHYALAAARALMDFDLTAEDIARRAMAIAADICVYTNRELTVETVPDGA